MGVLKNLKTILPLPSSWKNDEAHFGRRIADAISELFRQMLKREEKEKNLETAVAIYADGNTHAAIASGQYVYVQNHATLAEGLYVASAAIAADATLSGSNLTAVSGGVANLVYSLDGNVVHKTGAETVAGVKTFTDNLYAQGNLCAKNSATLPYITLRGSNQGSVSGIIYLRNGGTSTGNYDNAYFSFIEYAKKSNGTRGSYERYDLPTPSLGDNDDSVTYKIITTKNLSDITGYPSQICLESTDNTWANVWAKISVLATGDSATIYVNSKAIPVLTNNVISSNAHTGVIARKSDSEFRYLVRDVDNNIRVFTMSSVSSSSAGTFAGKNYDDDILIHTTQYQTTDFGSVTVADFQTALETLMENLDDGAMVSFKVSFTDSSTVLPTGAKTGIAVKSASTRRNAILQHSGSTAVNVYLGSYTSSGWVWKKIAKDDEVVHNTGAETVGGSKTFTAIPIFQNGVSPGFYFRGEGVASNGMILRALNCEMVSGVYGQPQFTVYEYSPKSDGSARTGGYEYYQLPAVDVGLASNAQRQYTIITTKNLSDIDTSQLSGVAKTYSTSVAKSSSASYTIGNSSRIVLDMFGSAANIMGNINIYSTSNGTTTFVKTGASDISVTKSGSTLTITNNNASNQVVIYGIVYLGSITKQS